jgi:CDP-diacylglycerol--glycerol-3-phosphate 3-phosphatidyltransferase
MPTLYDVKPRFQALLRPLVTGLATVGITPNQVTITTCICSILVGAFLAVEQRGWILLPVFLFVRMALNAVDGMLAREYGQQSRLGAVLNELTDVISDAVLTWPVAVLPGWNPLWVATAIFFALLTEMAGVLGLTIGSTRRHDGPFGKSDRALALGVLGCWLALGWPVSAWARATLPAVWIGLCFVTVVNRVRQALGYRR